MQERWPRPPSKGVGEAVLAKEKFAVEVHHCKDEIVYAHHKCAQVFVTVVAPRRNVDESYSILFGPTLCAYVRNAITRSLFGSA